MDNFILPIKRYDLYDWGDSTQRYDNQKVQDFYMKGTR